jgi:hypothetical protein
VEWTPADQTRAGTTQLDAVSLYDFGYRMLLAEPLRIDSFSCGLSYGHEGPVHLPTSDGRCVFTTAPFGRHPQ